MKLSDALLKFVLLPSWNQNYYHKKIGKRWYSSKIYNGEHCVIGNSLGISVSSSRSTAFTVKAMITAYRDGIIVENNELRYSTPYKTYKELLGVLNSCAVPISSDDNNRFWRLKNLSNTPMLNSGDFGQFINSYSESEV